MFTILRVVKRSVSYVVVSPSGQVLRKTTPVSSFQGSFVQTLPDEPLPPEAMRKALRSRQDLPSSNRIVVKMGSPVIAREDECGLELGRLASIVEQVSELHAAGKQMVVVTSGAIAFGRQKLRTELMLSTSMRQTLSRRNDVVNMVSSDVDKRACAASGMPGLMSLYEQLFLQYGIPTAQVLLTQPDISNEHRRQILRGTIDSLLNLSIIPIINTNDVVAASEDYKNHDIMTYVIDNDALASRLSVEIQADLLVLLTDVDGVLSHPPGHPAARVLHNVCPDDVESIVFAPALEPHSWWDNTRAVRTGGMRSKIDYALLAVRGGVATVIVNAFSETPLLRAIAGANIGTMVSTERMRVEIESNETLAAQCREASRKLSKLNADERKNILHCFAEIIDQNHDAILGANHTDCAADSENDTNESPIRLKTSDLTALTTDTRRIAANCTEELHSVVKKVLLADGMKAEQCRAPVGVVLAVVDCPLERVVQLMALCIATGNGLLISHRTPLKHTFYSIVRLLQKTLAETPGIQNAILLTDSSDDHIGELVQDTSLVDLIVPIGPSSLIKKLNKQKLVPVLCVPSTAVCHVFIDSEAEVDKAVKIVTDSKCTYDTTNSVQTLLIHRSLVNTPTFDKIYEVLRENKIRIRSGPKFAAAIRFPPPLADSLSIEYDSSEVTIELVSNVADAIDHVNEYGSGTTDVIVTENGANVGSTKSGPVGVDGLLNTRWVLHGHGDTVVDFERDDEKKRVFLHKILQSDYEE